MSIETHQTARRASVVGLLLLAACVGCGALPKARPAPPVVFKEFTADTLDDIRAVGIVPFTSDAAAGPSAEGVTEVFLTELQRTGRFHVVVVRDLSGVMDAPDGIDPKDPLKIDSLIAARRERGLDAVIVGDITQYHVYGTPVIGLDISMVSCKTGEVEWRVSAVFDSTRPDVISRLKYYCRHQEAKGGEHEEWRVLLSSPRRYAQFVAHEILASLADGRDALLRVDEAPMDRLFSLVRSLPEL